MARFVLRNSNAALSHVRVNDYGRGRPSSPIALIVPSVCFETFGIILFEAFAKASQ